MIQENELEPTEPGTELARVMAAGDPDLLLAVLEKKAQVAGRMRAAIEQIVVSQTYPRDWTIQGEGDRAIACLSSAGAERIARNFGIKYEKVEGKKQSFADEEGTAYRYVFTGYASLFDRTVYAEGSYSTRDEFLGKKDGKWRPLEEINEGDVRSAAHHIFCGNAIKELLGLRGLPAEEFRRIMVATGRDAGKAGTVDRGRGTQGGTNPEDSKQQKELAEICITIANAAHTVSLEDNGEFYLRPLADSDGRDTLAIAKDICLQISSFEGKDGQTVAGKGAKDLRGRWLGATLAKARKLKEQLPSDRTQDGGSDDGNLFPA